jgi:uncharacterized protein (DUF58 family)
MMSFSAKTRYLLVTAAIVVACAVQLVRGYRPLIVAVCGLTFLVAGNVSVYVSGAKQRAVRKQEKRDYYAGLR